MDTLWFIIDKVVKFYRRAWVAFLALFGILFGGIFVAYNSLVDKSQQHAIVIMMILFTITIFCVVILFMILDFIISKREVTNEKLWPHFRRMQQMVPGIIPTFTENLGYIYLSADNPKLPDEFIAHFPDEAVKWGKYYEDIKKHNEEPAKFQLKIKQAFESCGLKVLDIQGRYKSPYIYESIYHPLFAWWRDRLNPLGYQQVDFTRIEADFTRVDAPIQGPSNLKVFGWTSEFIAYVETEADKEKCKRVIWDIANNAEYERGAGSLIVSANRLRKLVSDLEAKLAGTIISVEEFWPGEKRGYKFRRVGKCTECKHIFG